MKIDFNNVRSQAINAYDRLVKKLNSEINNNEIFIEPEYIQKEMDELRSALISIVCTYRPDDEDFKDLTDEIGEIDDFNSYKDYEQFGDHKVFGLLQKI